ncbi:MAG TPA: glycosyltransferase family 1 protein [Gemmatimonadaceae bacterium]|nr:glycosyltransferase family 1 protein [Gemmatimonadaceae bacterium]
MTAQPLAVGIVCDLLEERWPSMDLVADQLLRALPDVPDPRIAAVRLRPAMPRWAAALADGTGIRALRNANRYADRHLRYPRWLRANRGDADVYHVVDHTYAHLVHELPAARTVVTCHDVDAFRCLFDPSAEPRSRAFRRMTARVLDGLRAAALVACDSEATRRALADNGLRREGTVVVPLGVDATFSPPAQLEPTRSVTLLHVGSTIPRKRIDVLLRTFAGVRAVLPEAVLVRVGGELTAEQSALARELGVLAAIRTLPFLSTQALAGVYRSATLVLLPSDREGFGLPLVEALACGTPVLASDLGVLREVGGEAATYAPAADVGAWTRTTLSLLDEQASNPGAWEARRQAGITRAAQFTWPRCAERMARLYAEVAHA